MPLPAIIGAAALGAGGSMAFEYVISGGKASRTDYAVAGVVGALPVGMTMRGATSLGKKALALRHYRGARRGGVDKLSDIPVIYLHPASTVFMGPELAAISTGVAANVAAGQVMDYLQSRGDQGGRLPSTPGVVKPGSIGSPSAPRIGARSTGRGIPSNSKGRASRAPYCRVHRREHRCKYTKR